MADFTGLDWAFKLPAEITDDEISAGYEAMRLRLQMEIEHMPITTTAAVRAERILHFYVLLKQAELDASMEPSDAKEVNAFLARLLKDWDDTIIRSKPTGQEAALKVEKQFKKIFVDVIGAVDMPAAIRNELVERLQHTVVMAGLDHG